MGLLFAGVWVLLATTILLWAFLPSGDPNRRFVGTKLKPTLVVAVGFGGLLGIGLIVLGLLGWAS